MLRLLADDIRQVRVMPNTFQTASGIQVRLENAIPALGANAQEIIALLRQEYPQ